MTEIKKARRREEIERGGTMTLKRHRQNPRHRRVVHHTALRLNQQRRRSLHHTQRSPKVEIEQLFASFNFRIQCWCDYGSASIVDEDVEFATCVCGDERDGGGDGGWGEDVEGEDDDVWEGGEGGRDLGGSAQAGEDVVVGGVEGVGEGGAESVC